VNDTLHISEAAALVGITTKAIRHYEKIGLLDPDRAENGYRLYRPADILRLERIRQLQSLGLSLQRIKQILDETENEDLWLLVLEGLLDEIDEEIDELEERRQRVIDLLDGELPDALAVGEAVPVSPRVQEFLDEHLAPEMWLKEQAIYMHLQSLFAPAVHMPPFVHLPLEPAGMPVGRVEWFGGPGESFR
jgi:DNA-binding transcriptional MerR regulator